MPTGMLLGSGGSGNLSGSSGGIDYQKILDTYKQLQDAANQANEARYQQIIGPGGIYDRVADLIATVGQGQQERIDMGAARAGADVNQSMISRGLGNTTIRNAAQRGVQDDANRASRELAESVASQQAGVELGRAGVMERRTDQGPDAGLIAQLMMSMGQAQALSQGTGGSGGGVINTGLSANARAGRTATGQPFQYTGSSGGGGGGSSSGGGSASYFNMGGSSGGGSSGGGSATYFGGGGGNTGAGNIFQGQAAQAAMPGMPEGFTPGTLISGGQSVDVQTGQRQDAGAESPSGQQTKTLHRGSQSVALPQDRWWELPFLGSAGWHE